MANRVPSIASGNTLFEHVRASGKLHLGPPECGGFPLAPRPSAIVLRSADPITLLLARVVCTPDDLPLMLFRHHPPPKVYFIKLHELKDLIIVILFFK